MGKINYDQKEGLGAIPWNQDVDYRGFRVWMLPEKFLECAPPMGPLHEIEDNKRMYLMAMTAYIKAGKPIASPYLEGVWEKNMWRITGHEGRHRCRAIRDLFPNELVEVHFIPTTQGIRARDITLDMVKSFAAKVKSQGGPMVTDVAKVFKLRGEMIRL